VTTISQTAAAHGVAYRCEPGTYRDPASGAEPSEDLATLTYPDLIRIASSFMGRERPGHTLEPTTLVHEAYLRLRRQRRTRWQNKGHFLATATQMMRRVLIDHARRRATYKRGGDVQRIDSDLLEVMVSRETEEPTVRLALEKLGQVDPEAAAVLALRVHQGRSMAEIGAKMGLSRRSVDRRWKRATSWLGKELSL